MSVSAITTSRLLDIPRELHGLIYELVTSDVRVSDVPGPGASLGTEGWYPFITLRKTIDPALAYACKQLYNEYRETVLSKSILDVNLVRSGIKYPLIPWEPSVPTEAFYGIKNCVITMSWDAVLLHWEDRDSWHPWRACHFLGYPNTTGWTPAKELCRRVESLLVELSSLLHPSATVTILFLMEGMPDPTDPYSPAWARRRFLLDFARAAEAHAAFDKDTIFSVGDDGQRAWPQRGKLRVVAQLDMSLVSGVAENRAEVATG